MLASLSPVSEVMNRIIKTQLGGELSDDRWEVDFWNHIFDWDRAGLSLSPGYWTKNAPRDALRGPNHFLNASWARLYLPVRPGKERLALRWIIGHVRGGPLDAATEQALERLISELRAFRETSFGDPLETNVANGELDEQVLTLARSYETLPTDGTHFEVVQSMTSAIDSNTHDEIESARELASIRAAEEMQDIELKKRAVAHIATNASNKLNYTVGISTTPEDSNHTP
jgi:hypothetical protein